MGHTSPKVSVFWRVLFYEYHNLGIFYGSNRSTSPVSRCCCGTKPSISDEAKPHCKNAVGLRNKKEKDKRTHETSLTITEMSWGWYTLMTWDNLCAVVPWTAVTRWALPVRLCLDSIPQGLRHQAAPHFLYKPVISLPFFFLLPFQRCKLFFSLWNILPPGLLEYWAKAPWG